MHDLKMIDASPGFELTSRDPGPQQPYWVVSAKPAVTDGHNGIFQAPFLKFLAALVFEHVAESLVAAGGASVSGYPGPSLSARSSDECRQHGKAPTQRW